MACDPLLFAKRKGLQMERRMMTRIVRAGATLALLSGLVGCAAIHSDDGSSISLERSRCYGSCSAYRFTLYADDHYMWQGRANVSITGPVRGRMDAGTYAAAKKLLLAAQYLEFNDSYQDGNACEIWQTDNQTVKIEVADAIGSKTIAHYLGCKGFARQEDLARLEEGLDKIFGTHRFVR